LPDERVLRQLVEALLFERIASWSGDHLAPGTAGEREIAFCVGRRAYRCRGRVGAFGRVRVAPGSVKQASGHDLRDTSWRELLHELPCSGLVKAEVAEELENTVRLCRWNQEQLPRLRQSRRGLTYEELEGLLHEGHPYHPCFKARAGFSLDDHAAYGPEAERSFPLRWLAVRRSCLSERLPIAEREHLRLELGADDAVALERARHGAGVAGEQYGVLPVHPWQWKELADSPALAAAFTRGELVALNVEAGQYRASQSLRTLLPVGRPLASHLKLPLAVRISSSLRTLQPETVKAAPALSTWLKSLVARDPFFAEVSGVVVLAEHGSSVYVASGPETGDLEGNLAAIWREPIGAHLRDCESAVPFNALFASESDGRPHVDGWIERHGLTAWLRQVLRVTLLPLWRLVAHHGVALESHAQNLLLLHVDGWPRRLALRDFHDSVEYVPSFLAEPALVPNWSGIDARFRTSWPGRHYEMSSVVELRDLFIDSVLIFNLCELSWLLEQHYAFSEPEFWSLVRSVLHDYARSSWNDGERATRLRLHAPYVQTESLFKARLRTPAETLFVHTVPSALHDHFEGKTHAGYQ
jgi:3,4-dihydroxybenzoyl-citryl-spermidine/N-citryl-spermidine--spermidine ligase